MSAYAGLFGQRRCSSRVWEFEMARSPINLSPPDVYSTTRLCDKNGNVILEVGYSDFTVNYDGREVQHKLGSSIQLVDGSQWGPMMLMGPNPTFLGVCDSCRDPKFFGLTRRKASHGLVALDRAKTCVDCGQLCCRAHSKKIGGGWRCLSCTRKFKIKRFFTRIFYK